MAALEHPVQGGRRQALLAQIFGFRLVDLKELEQALRVGGFEVVGALALFKRQPDVAIAALAIPLQLPKALHVLEIHGQTLEAVGDLNRDGLAIEAAALLEVGELGHLHAIKPHLPADTPGAECRGLPVVFDEADVVISGLDAQGFQGAQVGLLDAIR